METNTIVNGIGSPRVWLYIDSGEIMKDFDEQPISKYLSKFNYTYNEEQDDECKLVFKFPSLKPFDLPYLKQDTTFQVEWGYICLGGQIIKSPKRLVAIRDMEVNYKQDGIMVTLNCTDLVSYIKGMKTTSSGNYTKELIPGTDTPENRFYNASIVALALQINERTNGGVTFTQRRFDDILRINTTGELKVQSKKNPFSNIPNNNMIAANRSFHERPRVDDLVVKGSAKSYDQLMKKAIEEAQNDRAGKDFGKPLILDSTDNNLELKYRDFTQPIFKSFTWYGGNGELLEFTAGTNTRKNKKTKTASAGIDPFTKKYSTSTVDTVDSAKYSKYSKGTMEAVLKSLGDQFKRDYMNHGIVNGTYNDKVVIKTFKGKEIDIAKEKITLEEGPVFSILNQLFDKESDRTTEKDIYDYRTYNYKDIVQSPDWKSFISKRLKQKPLTKDRIINRLTGHTIETIHRKYEAQAKMIGDPTLIKGKIYQINNLRKEDIGKWYALSVSHDLDFDSGYTCTMNFMRNPRPIGISAKTVSINPKFNRRTNTLDIEPEIDDFTNIMYEQEDEDNEKTITGIDEGKRDKVFREPSPIDSMIERSIILQADTDIINEIDKNPEYNVYSNETIINNNINTEDN